MNTFNFPIPNSCNHRGHTVWPKKKLNHHLRTRLHRRASRMHWAAFVVLPSLSVSISRPRSRTCEAIITKMSSAQEEEERFDVLNADGSFAGYSKPRSAVHRDGDWHRSTHIWVIDTQGSILVQRRSGLKDTFPVCEALLSV